MKLGRFDLRKLRQRDIAIIFIVLTLASAAAWYFYMYRPTLDRVTELENDLSQLSVQIQRGEAAQRNLPTLRLEVAQLELERLAFLAELPRESEVADLIRQLRASAQDADVILENLSQGSVSESIQDVRPIGFTLSTTGTYGTTMAFLRSLEELRRFTKIRQVGLSVADDGVDDPTLSSNFALTVYVFTGADPGAE